VNVGWKIAVGFIDDAGEERDVQALVAALTTDPDGAGDRMSLRNRRRRFCGPLRILMTSTLTPCRETARFGASLRQELFR
jgi:hypothetical protein